MIATLEGMEVYKQAENLNALFYELENCSLPKNNVFLQEQCYNVTKEKHCTYGDRLIRGEENEI